MRILKRNDINKCFDKINEIVGVNRTPVKAYFKYLGNSFNVNPSELVYISFVFSSFLLDFSILFSFKLKIVSFKSKPEVINS